METMSVEIAIEMLHSILIQAGRDSVRMKRVGGKKQKHWIDKSLRGGSKKAKGLRSLLNKSKIKIK